MLAALAFAMQDHPHGRQVRVSAPWAAEALAAYFGPGPEAERTAHAAQFLEEEAADSGIVVSRGGELQFWHMTFQEYLAAKHLAGLPDAEITERLVVSEKIYQPEWREVVLLCFSLLGSWSDAKTELLLVQMFQNASKGSTWQKATAIVILGAIIREITTLALSHESRTFANSLITDLSRSDLHSLNLRLWIELSSACARFDFVPEHELQAIRVPSDLLLQCALHDGESSARDLAITTLVANDFDNPDVQRSLEQVAHSSSRASRGVIEKAFESRFPNWKRWLVGFENTDRVPETFDVGIPLTAVRVRLRNIKGFEDTGIVDIPRALCLFVGENSAGKSTLLRSIALAMVGVELANQIEQRAFSYLRHGAEQGAIEVSFAPYGGLSTAEEFVVGLGIQKGETAFRALAPSEMSLALHNCSSRLDILRRRAEDKFGFSCAYGPFRAFSDTASMATRWEKIALDRIASLFDPHATVIDPELAVKLFSGQVAVFRGAPERLSPELVGVMQKSLCGLLPGSSETSQTAPDGISLHGSAIPIRDLSDGYSSLVALVGHLCRYSLENSNWREDPTANSGLALIDEIDAHLHPRWQRHILPDLRTAFPNFQILATTHSAMVAGSIDAASIYHLSRNEERDSVQIRRYEMSVQGLDADEILMGLLFGLDDTRDVGTEEDEKRYDQLRSLDSPSQEENAERERLAQKLFRKGLERFEPERRGIYEAIESSLKQKFQSLSPGELAGRLAAAKRLLEKN